MNHPDKTNLRTPDIENVNVTDFDAMSSPEEIHARVPLSEIGLSKIRGQLEEIYRHMAQRGIPAGGKLRV